MIRRLVDWWLRHEYVRGDESTVTHPVRENGQPAKHLEVTHTYQEETHTRGRWRKKTRKRLHTNGVAGEWSEWTRV